MLEKTARRWLRIIHIVLIASLIGGLVSIFAISRIAGLDSRALFIANYSIYSLFNSVITFSFYGIVTTGLIYSVFTHWGLTKYWWIMAKWLGTLTGFFLVWIWLGPAINGMVSLSDAATTSDHLDPQYAVYASRIGPAIFVLLAVFITLIVITIFKPWGQREQRYELKRGTILFLTGFAVVLSIGFGLLGYYDLESYRNMAVGTPDLSKIEDGRYQGQASYAGFDYSIELSVTGHRIVDIKVLANRDSPYARNAEGILPRILQHQSPDVDAITGATTTSKCLMKAAESALEGATE